MKTAHARVEDFEEAELDIGLDLDEEDLGLSWDAGEVERIAFQLGARSFDLG